MRSRHSRENGDEDSNGHQGSVWETQAFKKAKETVTTFSEKTSLSFKLIVPICAVIITGTIKITRAIGKMETAMSQSWSIQNQEAFARKMERENPDISVPDVRDIFERQSKAVKLIE